MNGARTLGSTYRLQLAGLGFEGARHLVDYLADFGVDTLYVSPIFAAVPGSTHGYDVVDPTRLDPSLGTTEEFEALLGELATHAMRLLIDIVPNHMAVHPDNRWWWNTLARGEDSVYASTFDIEWSRHHGRVMVATLPRPLSECLDAAAFGADGAEHFLDLAGQRFPLADDTPLTSDLEAVLTQQHYRPAYWRLSNLEGNYRRFFDIDTLIGVRVEDPEIFGRTHRLVGALARDPRIAGWRVDHVDGLSDPAAYLERLRELTSGERSAPATIIVEKIVARGEALPREWPVEGTTGYEFADHVGGLFVNDEGARQLDSAGAAMTGDDRTFADLALEAKGEVLATSFVAALERLTRLAMTALNETHPGHDLSGAALRQAIASITSHLTVYRTYLTKGSPSDEDTQRLARALDEATSSSLGEVRRGVDLVGELLGDRASEGLELIQRWQQLSSAVMAKGVEDTATYRYSGLLSHAEVGCDPQHPTTTPREFHQFLTLRGSYPQTLNATSTHDSKRSDDARARLFTLSEAPTTWTRLVSKWHRRYVVGARGLDAHDELVTYQSFVCLWPTSGSRVTRDLTQRLQGYLVKSAREAKRHTSWTDPDPRYERSLTSFVAALSRDDQFRLEMSRLMDRIGPAAATNSLAMAVLKCVAPGVPDFYQGGELWDLSLTDPDNRRPVDFDRRRKMLARLPVEPSAPGFSASEVRSLLDRWPDGAIKLYIQRALLQLRRAHSPLFDQGSLHLLRASGPLSSHVVPLARRLRDVWLVAVVPRHILDVAGAGVFATGDRVWGQDTNLHLPSGAPREFHDIFTGSSVRASRGTFRVAECLSTFPVSVLISQR